MGQEILYCCHCQLQLRSRDFDSGAAFRLDSRVFCQKCAPDVIKSMPAAALQDLIKQKTPARPLPAETPRPHPLLTSSSTLNSTILTRDARPSSSIGIVVAVVVGIVIVLLLVVASSGSGPAREPRSFPSTASPREVSVPPPPSRDPRPPTDAPPRLPPPGADPLRTAREYVKSNSSDYAGQVELYDRAVESLRNSPAQEDAKRELESVRKSARERIASELGTLDPRTRELCDREEFDAALEAIEGARRRMNAPEWTAAIRQRNEEVRRKAAELFASVKDKTLDARRRGAAEELKAIQARVAHWGMQNFVADLAALLPAPPDPKNSAPTPEAVAFARSRETAFRHALARDYASATVELKRGTEAVREAALQKIAAQDGEFLKQASQALKDAQQMTSKWTKGQKVSLDLVDPAGAVQRVDGSILRTDPFRIEVERSGAEPAIVLLREIRAASLTKALQQARGALTPPDARALALLCLLEGDSEAARAFVEEATGDIPERIWSWAKESSTPGPTAAREQEARTLLYSAERPYDDPSTAVEAARTYESLLKDYSDTLVVRRNRAYIAARSQGGKDFVFFPEDMKSGGSFARVKNAKTETCFQSDSDTEPARTKDNFVELTFSGLPETEYHCWVYVGACCAETFAFFYQASELGGVPKDAKDPVACEPGSAAFLPAKHTLLSLKKTHAQHSGPKAPLRWEWVQLGLPKFAAVGPKKLRVLTNQQGFSLAFASIISSKPGHPRESEFKALENARNQTPGAKILSRVAAPPADKPPPSDQVVVLSYDLEGGKRPPGLGNGSVVKAPDRADNRYCFFGDPLPNGASPVYIGDGGEAKFTFEGEEVLNFDYWVDSAVEGISFNFGDRTRGEQHYGGFSKPTPGKWTHVSFRLADLVDTKLKIGDRVGTFYIQALGGSTRKFFVDNIQVVRPRAKK